MKKLIEQFQNDKSVKNAQKLVAYLNKHIMSECLASHEDLLLINEARTIIKG